VLFATEISPEISPFHINPITAGLLKMEEIKMHEEILIT